MDRPRRDALVDIALAVLVASLLLALSSRDVFWSGDFLDESWPAYFALVHQGPSAFLARAPAYAPFATLVGVPATLLLDAFGGGLDRAMTHIDALFRLVALPGLAALVVLSLRLGRDARRSDASRLARPLILVLTAGSPLAARALVAGHPEDLVAAAAAVGAVLLARDGRIWRAGVLLAIAIATKQWAVLAAGPVLLAAPRGGVKAAVLGLTGGVAAFVPFALARPEMHASYVAAGNYFHPQQVWWPLGVPAPAAWEAAGHGSLVAPAWLAPIPHLLIVALAVPVCLAWWRRAGEARRAHDALALLALLFLVRCALDPWNLGYYQLPLVLALGAWEAGRGRGLPLLTLGVTAATWLTFVTYSARTGWGPFVAYFVWVLPLAAFLAHQLFARPATARATVPAHAVPATA